MLTLNVASGDLTLSVASGDLALYATAAGRQSAHGLKPAASASLWEEKITRFSRSRESIPPHVGKQKYRPASLPKYRTPDAASFSSVAG